MRRLTLAGRASRQLASARSTILDKISKFAKSLLGSIFVSEQRFDYGAPDVRLTQMCSKFLVCLSGALHKFYCARSRLMSPLIELWDATKLCGRKHDPRARYCSALRVRQTRNPSDTVCVRRTSDAPLSKLERTTNHRRSQAEISCKFMILDS